MAATTGNGSPWNFTIGMLLLIGVLLLAVQTHQVNEILTTVDRNARIYQEESRAARQSQRREHAAVICLLRIPLESRSDAVIMACINEPPIVP